MTDRYSFSIQWSEENGGFVATSPEFPGLSAFGETRAEAINEAETALSLFIESLEEEGTPLPQPNEVKEFSGQFRVRLPKSLHRRLSTTAESEGVSLNTFVITSLTTAVVTQRVKKTG